MDRVSIISLVVGSVLPLLTATATKSSWPIWVKQLLTAALSALTGVGVDLEHSGGPAVAVIVANALTTFATAAAVLAATWKPTGVLGKLEAVFIRDTPAFAGTVTKIASELSGSSSSSAPSSATISALASAPIPRGSDAASATPPSQG
jgi:hypothetical protein